MIAYTAISRKSGVLNSLITRRDYRKDKEKRMKNRGIRKKYAG